MKKYMAVFMILVLAIIPCLLRAAGTVTQAYAPIYSSEGITNMSTLTMAWTSDASGAASAATSTTISDQIAGKYIVTVATIPGTGTTEPTLNYDIAINDANSVDVMGSVLLNRSSGATEQVTPYIGALYGPRPIAGAITLSVTNAGSGKTGSVVIYLSRQR